MDFINWCFAALNDHCSPLFVPVKSSVFVKVVVVPFFLVKLKYVYGSLCLQNVNLVI
jgi:hypothetical protein